LRSSGLAFKSWSSKCGYLCLPKSFWISL